MIDPGFRNHIESVLAGKTGNDFRIIDIQPVGGGCINHAVKVSGTMQSYFLKWNDAHAYPGMFEAEAKGLLLLSGTKTISVPAVIATGQYESDSFLILEWIESGRRTKNFWEDFGRKLAALHRFSSATFGLDHDNYIGSLPQSNRSHESGVDFFIRERLEPQLDIALRSGAFDTSWKNRLERLCEKLPALIPSEQPALLHGDLWSGNYMAGPDGAACLIDPAVYYGHRETDLAMTRLFGGFDHAFYSSYNEEFPLTKGHESRVGLFNLYPLLVHVNIFGGSYVQQVEGILRGYL